MEWEICIAVLYLGLSAAIEWANRYILWIFHEDQSISASDRRAHVCVCDKNRWIDSTKMAEIKNRDTQSHGNMFSCGS